MAGNHLQRPHHDFTIDVTVILLRIRGLQVLYYKLFPLLIHVLVEVILRELG